MIDEKKLIEDLMNNYLVKNDGSWNDAMDRVIELIKTAPKTDWIPVTERLPERNKCVLIYAESTTISGGHVRLVGSCDNGFWFYQSSVDRQSYPIQGFKAVAWMPLPEPYKGGVTMCDVKLTIDEAIEHCLEKANDCSTCGKEHLQLAEWLKELKHLRGAIERIFDRLQEKAINTRGNAIEMSFIGMSKVINELDYGMSLAYADAVKIVKEEGEQK